MSDYPQCANCFAQVLWRPVLHKGQPYCCEGCAHGGPCTCTYTDAPIEASAGARSAATPDLPLQELECANCFSGFYWSPVYFEGKPYCCEGCARGGPCICTYEGPPPRLDAGAGPVPSPVRPGATGGKANRFWAGPGPQLPAKAKATGALRRANRLWGGQEPEESPEEVETQASQAGPPSPGQAASSERLLLLASPLPSLLDVKMFMVQLESLASVKGVMLIQYEAARAVYTVEAPAVQAVVKDLMDVEYFRVRSLRVTPDGLEVSLWPRGEAPESAPQAQAAMAAGATLATGASAPEDRPPTTPVPGPRAKARTGDEGELHPFRYEMGVDVFFNGRHQVEVSGVRGPAHMHSWRVQAILEGEPLDEAGLVVGTDEVRDIIARFVARYNEKLLNKVPPFDEVMPTASNIARVIYEHTAMELAGRVVLKAIRLWESPTSYVEYAGERSGG